MPDSIKVLARAKVNLFLRVGRKRADGYHDLETLFHSIALADSVEIFRVPTREVTLNCALDIPFEKNLAMRAARAFLARSGDEGIGLSIRLAKTIPMGAGLAGGSADAAAVLVGLNALLDTPFGTAELATIGAKLGADVPFCVMGGMADGRGIGDRLRALPPQRFDLVVVKPSVSVSTPWAFGALDDSKGQGIAGDLDAIIARLSCADGEGVAGIGDEAGNDFERVILPAHPEIARARDALGEEGAAWAMMSGSGAAVFGVFRDADAAHQAGERLTEQLAGYEVHVTRGAARGAEVVG